MRTDQFRMWGDEVGCGTIQCNQCWASYSPPLFTDCDEVFGLFVGFAMAHRCEVKP